MVTNDAINFEPTGLELFPELKTNFKQILPQAYSLTVFDAFDCTKLSFWKGQILQ